MEGPGCGMRRPVHSRKPSHSRAALARRFSTQSSSFPVLQPAERRLHLGHAPVGPERLVKPAKAGGLVGATHGGKALAVILERPGT